MTNPLRTRYAGGWPEYIDVFWDDLRFPAQTISIFGFGTDPDVDTSEGNFLFSPSTTEILFGTAQMPHSWKIGSTLSPHVHWSPTTTNTGDVLWRFSYQMVDFEGTFSGSYTDVDVLDAGSGTAEKHQIAAFADLDASSLTGVSPIIKWKIARIGGDNTDTYTADARLLEFDIHYQIDRPGSRQEYVK